MDFPRVMKVPATTGNAWSTNIYEYKKELSNVDYIFHHLACNFVNSVHLALFRNIVAFWTTLRIKFQSMQIVYILGFLLTIANVLHALQTPKHIPSVSLALREKRKQFVNFWSGGIAGSVAATAMMPLDVIKTQMQSSSVESRQNIVKIAQDIVKTSGPQGFFKGLLPSIVGILPTRGLYFWTYTTTKDKLKKYVGDTPINHLSSAVAAGIVSNTVTNPLWMVKTRYQLLGNTMLGQKQYANYREVVQDIWKTEGPKGFFKGLAASYMGCFEGAIQWIVYEKCKNYLITGKKQQGKDVKNKLTPFELFASAGIAKFVAICATYPHEVIRTRMREQALNGIFKYSGFMSTFTTIAKEEGIKGLYAGMSMHLLRSVPNSALMLLTFELTSSFLHDKLNTTANASNSQD